MNIKVKLFCSSFIFSKKSSWERLNKITSDLNFSEYGKIIPSIIDLKNHDVNVLILFHQDIHEKKTIEAKRYNTIIFELEILLKKNKGILILGYSSYLNNQITRLAKTIPISNLSAQNFKRKIYKLAAKYPNLYILDLDSIFSEIGYARIFDSRNWYFSHMRLSLLGLKAVDNSIACILNRIYNTNAKVLVLDCDNTLWGGIIGEEGLSKIILGTDGIGKAYIDFQKTILKLQESGIILSLCSKNNEDDVWDVFNNHPAMVLKKNKITNSRINWSEKYLNLIQIAEELSLSLNSLVFWDDDAVERAKVKSKLPEVNVIDVPDEIIHWAKILDELDVFGKFDTYADDKEKSKQYKSKLEYDNKKKLSNDMTAFLKTIQMKPKIIRLAKKNISRASQLSQKTNQFNMRTKRYTQSEIINLMGQKKYNLYICSAVDLFGDYGYIALAIVKKLEDKEAFLESFLMSCRILGRDMELWFFQSILNELKSESVNKLLIEYIPNTKNIVINDFIKKCKLKRTNRNYAQKELNAIMFEINTNSEVIDINKLYE